MRRWLIFGVVLLVSAALLMVLPQQIAVAALIGLMLVSLAFAVVFQSQRTPAVRSAQSVSAAQAGQITQVASQPIPHPAPQGGFAQPRLGWVAQARWGQWFILVSGLAVMFIGQYQIYNDPLFTPVSGGFVLLFIGLGMIFTVLNGALPAYPALVETPATVQPLLLRWRWLFAALALLLFTAFRSVIRPQEAYLGEQLLTWALGMLCFVRAAAPLDGSPRQPDNKRLVALEYALLIGLFMGALAVRGVNLNIEPPILDQDEAMFAQEAATIRFENFLITPFEPGAQSWPRLYQSLIGVAVAIFGPTLAAARIPAALFGALTIPAIYLLGRELGGWRIGLIAAMFALPWSFHVQFSRLALNQTGDPLFATLTFYFFVRGLRRGAAVDFALAGIMLGLSQMFYLGGRIIPFVLIGLVVWLWLRQREIIVRQWRLLLLTALGAFLLLLPHHYFLAYTGQPLTTRADKNIFVSGQWDDVIKSGASISEYLINQVKRSFLATIWVNDMGFWYGYGSSILGLFGGPFFIIGTVVAALILWNRPKWSLLPGWVLAVLFFGSTLSISPPQFQRYVIAAAPFSILVALGVTTFAFGLARTLQRPELEHRAALIIGVALLALNFWYYVGVYVPRGLYLNNRPNWATNQTARAMVQASNGGKQVVLLYDYATGVENTLVVQYFMAGRDYIIYDDEGLQNFDPRKPFAFIAGPGRKPDLDRLIPTFPGGRLRMVYLAEDNSLGFYIYEKP